MSSILVCMVIGMEIRPLDDQAVPGQDIDFLSNNSYLDDPFGIGGIDERNEKIVSGL